MPVVSKDQKRDVRPLLFQPITLRGVVAKNRIMASPMCQYLSVDGSPTDWHVAHLGRLAIGGAGIVCCEETAVEARGRKTYHCAGIWSGDHIPKYRRIADLLRSLGAVPAIQLGHSGAKASSHGAMQGWTPLTEEDAKQGCPPWQGLSASAVSSSPGRPLPKAMDADDIRAVVRAWRDAAGRALDAGFDVLEIHGAHGYLIHQFLSPVTNRRTDAYGGDRAGRMRLAIEIAEAIRTVWPADRPLFFRISCVDGPGGIWDVADTICLAGELKERGVDAIDCSSGGISGPSTMGVVPRVPGYQVPYASRVRKGAGIKTVAVGMITEGRQAEDILQRGDADIVALARELLRNGDWPANAARELGVPDHYNLYPEGYAYRLRRLEEVKSLDLNKYGGQIPLSVSEFIDAN
ncbi:MAG: NADH:flavin oxidoreductase/NADH oxidase [Rhodospirillales bacterium]|nr:NADH:flavin oxidoreductase/NADH oxidase [Rhodospirillales bacterium]